MVEIYLIRHAQAEGNLFHMIQGFWDGDITPLGKKQVDALSLAFRDIHIDALYSSDLFRARYTATAISRGRSIPLQTDIRLREMNLGKWEAEFIGNIAYEAPKDFHMLIKKQESFRFETAETFSDVKKRSVSAMNDIVEANPSRTVAVVSHGLAIRCLLSALCGLDIEDLNALPLFANTGVAHLRYDNGVYTLLSLNEHSHLTDELMPKISLNANLRHTYINPAEYKDYYIACYTDSWKAAHGSLDGFDAQSYYAAALEHYAKDHESVAIIYNGEEPVGLVDMDTAHGSHADYGWISLLYLKEEYRSKSYGIQLLARAIKKYERMGRRSIRLLVAEDNKAAISFYMKNGFKMLSSQPGSLGTLLLLERKLGGKRDGDV